MTRSEKRKGSGLVLESIKLQVWLLGNVLAAVIFVVAIDWFSKSLLQLAFGAEVDDEMLVTLYQIGLIVNDYRLASVPLSPVIIAASLLAAFIISWLLRSSRNSAASENEDRSTRSSRQGNQPLGPGQKLFIFLAIISFGVSLGWVSTGLEQVLFGDLHRLYSVPFRFLVVFYSLIASGIAVIVYRALTQKSTFRSQSVLILLLLLSLFIPFSPLDASLKLSSLLALLASVSGYILLTEVQFHATPSNFRHEKNPRRHKYLVFFVSSNRKSEPVDDGLSADQFKIELQKKCQQALPLDLIDNLGQALDHWKEIDVDMTSKPIIRLPFAEFVIDSVCNLHADLEALSRDVAKRKDFPEAVSELIERAQTLPRPRQKTYGDSFSANLLALELISSLVRFHAPTIAHHMPLSDLIKYLQHLTGGFFNWLMPVMAVEFHRHYIRAEDASDTVLKKAIFIFSRRINQTKGSVETARSFAWLMEVVMRGYYAIPADEALFGLYDDGENADRDLTLSQILKGDLTLDQDAGIDFESFEECRAAIMAIIKHRIRRDQHEIVIDFTGGQKPTSMAAVLATTSSAVVSQYIGTNDYQFYSFDLRYHDIWALLS